jgi:GTPase involved in cell partitioning and DNA repair
MNLNHLEKRYSAEDGSRGKDTRGRGTTGEDQIIVVPKGTVISEFVPPIPPQQWLQSENIDAEYQTNNSKISLPHPPLFIDTSHPLLSVGTRFLVALGGAGGRGNHAFASSSNRSPMEFTEGEHGQIRYLRCELKTIADVGLVGMPNAGKSSFLSSVSRSRTQVGHWAFTTLTPYLGTIQFPAERVVRDERGVTYVVKDAAATIDRSNDAHTSSLIAPPFTLYIADIPGIIAGAASMNRGLGHAFLRHIERARTFIYILDISHPQPYAHLLTLIRELETYQPGMALQRPGLILANKADVIERDGMDVSKEVKDNVQVLQALGRWLRCMKPKRWQDIPSDEQSISDAVKELDSKIETAASQSNCAWDVIPVSSLYRKNLGKALWRIRDMVQACRVREHEEFQTLMKQDHTSAEEGTERIWNRPEYIRNVYQIQSIVDSRTKMK